MNNFTERKLSFRFFRRNDRQTIAFIGADYPSTVSVECSGLPSLNQAEIKIYNLNKNLMSLLTFLTFKNLNVSDVSIECLVEKDTVFVGDIVSSTPVYDMPDIYLLVKAMTDIVYLIAPSKDIVYSIPRNQEYVEIPVKRIVQDILKDTKKAITFNDVGTARIFYPRYLGSKIQQLEKLKLDADINIIINHNIIRVFSKKSGVSDDVLNIDGSSNNIVGQISNNKEGVQFTCLFNNNLELGGKIEIRNNKINPQANGIFYVYTVVHSLSNQIADGDFFTTVKARYIGE